MTEQRKRRIRTKIQEARGRLLSERPFFGLLLMYLKFVSVPKMKKISTNGRCIYFSPDFIEKLNYHELDYILCHQVLHIVCGHIWQSRDVAGDDYHFACDIFLNLILENYGFDKNRYPHLGYAYGQISNSIDFRDKSPEEICERLPYSLYIFNEEIRSKFLVDNSCWWDQKNDNGEAGEVIIDLPELTGRLNDGSGGGESLSGIEEDGAGCENEGNAEQKWQARAASVAKSLENYVTDGKSAGSVPGFIKRMIDKYRDPALDWKKILNNFLQERICDYSFSPPDRRFADTDFFLPDFNEKEFVSKEILFMVDTSGSVNDDALAEVYSEIKGAIEQFSGKLIGKLGFFDAQVIEPLPFETVDDLLSIMPYGGGGTDFGIIFDYIADGDLKDLPACIVIFTDGEADYPPKEVALDIPVLWIIDNNKNTPPWGTVVRIISSECS